MKKIFKIVVISVLVAGTAFGIYSVKNAGIKAKVFKVTQTEIAQYVEESAIVKAVDKQTIYGEAMGTIAQIQKNVGEKVSKGEVIVKIRNDSLAFQLKDAEAKIQQARAQIQGTALENFENKILLAKAQVEQANLALHAAQKDFENVQQLYETNMISLEERDKAENACKLAAANVKTANVSLKDAKDGTPAYLKNSLDAQMEQAINNRDGILRQMEKLEVHAPADGIILEKLLEKDAPVSPGTGIYIVGNTSNLILVADVLTDNIANVQVGQGVEISGKTINDKILKGRVSRLAPAAKIVTSTLGVNQNRIPVDVEILESSQLLKPGYNMDIKIITAQKSGIFKVPDGALFDYQNKPSVFVVENGAATIKNVVKGIESDNFVEVQGLKEGDWVLKSPDNSITIGAKILPESGDGKE